MRPKLSESKRREIKERYRASYNSGVFRPIKVASELGVSLSTVYRVINGYKWRSDFLPEGDP